MAEASSASECWTSPLCILVQLVEARIAGGVQFQLSRIAKLLKHGAAQSIGADLPVVEPKKDR